MSTRHIKVTVKEASGAYATTLHGFRASATSGAETAVRRVVEKYLAGTDMVLLRTECVKRLEDGREIWEIFWDAKVGSPVSFYVTADERKLITKIVDRCEKAGITEKIDRQTHLMDLTACHANGCPLKLEKMLSWERDFDLAHDVWGINRHIDRKTGEMPDCFLPRFARGEHDHANHIEEKREA